MSEMDRSNPSSIHGTETTSYPAGSLSENDTSNQRESDQISEPVARPEIRRMTPSDDVEPEIDDLHPLVHNAHQRSKKTEALNLPNRAPVQCRKLTK